MYYLYKFFILSCFLTISSTQAIVIRHDIEDSLYKELAHPYSKTMAYLNGCTGTLISSNWVLTAAHCIYGRERSLYAVNHLEKLYRIEKVALHPKYNNKSGEDFDIALIQLKDSILNGKPATLYFGTDEKDKEVVFVGNGGFGNGRDGLIKDDYIPRAATNTVRAVSPKWLEFKFDKPPKSTPLEGISGPGDSGGPAFIEVNSELYIVGVSSWQDSRGDAEGMYNVREFYSRVSSYKNWLQSTMKTLEPKKQIEHPLIEAIKNNDEQQFNKATSHSKEWLSDSTLVNDAMTQTILQDHIPFMERLTELGVPFNSAIINKLSLFDFALLNNRKRYFLALLKKSAFELNIHKPNSIIVPLLIYRFSNDERLTNLVRTALAQGANINASTSQGETALHIAVQVSNNLDLIDLLVKHGASVNSSNHNGDTALLDAANLGKKRILSYLLSKGANRNHQNNSSNTALDLAKNAKREDIVKLLLTK